MGAHTWLADNMHIGWVEATQLNSCMFGKHLEVIVEDVSEEFTQARDGQFNMGYERCTFFLTAAICLADENPGHVVKKGNNCISLAVMFWWQLNIMIWPTTLLPEAHLKTDTSQGNTYDRFSRVPRRATPLICTTGHSCSCRWVSGSPFCT